MNLALGMAIHGSLSTRTYTGILYSSCRRRAMLAKGQSVPRRPAARELPIDLSVRIDDCRRRPILCDLECLLVSFLEERLEIGSLPGPLPPVGEVGGLVAITPEGDGMEDRKSTR